MKRKVMIDDEFLDALECILEEFGRCDLEPRLDYFRDEGDDDAADCLEQSFALVEKWYTAKRPARGAELSVWVRGIGEMKEEASR
jgi:hypothetical protein